MVDVLYGTVRIFKTFYHFLSDYGFHGLQELPISKYLGITHFTLYWVGLQEIATSGKQIPSTEKRIYADGISCNRADLEITHFTIYGYPFQYLGLPFYNIQDYVPFSIFRITLLQYLGNAGPNSKPHVLIVSV